MEKVRGELSETFEWVRSTIKLGQLSAKQLQPVFSFLLIWSIFEGKLFKEKDKNRLDVDGLIKLSKITCCNFDQELICKIYGKLFDRYFGPDLVVGAFKNLQLNDNTKKLFFKSEKVNDKKFVTSVMDNTSPSFEEKLAASLLVTHRFRNNLYHGIKRVDKLNEYQEVFSVINKLIKHIAEICPEGWHQRS